MQCSYNHLIEMFDLKSLEAGICAFACQTEFLLDMMTAELRIPTQSGQGFRFDVGHRSDLIPATIPK